MSEKLFVDNASDVLKKSQVVWGAVAAFLLGLAETQQAELVQLLPLLQPYVAPGTFLKLAMFVNLVLPLLRVIKQASLHQPTK